MAEHAEAAESSFFHDIFSMEPKKVTAVYKRRPKKAEPQHPDRSSIGLGTTTGKESGIFVFRDEGAKSRDILGRKIKGRKDSWLHRSLSFRGRRSSLMPTHRQPLGSLASNIYGNPSNILLKSNPGNLASKTRRTWAGVPSSYVKEQRAIFADVDAFDLDEKEAGFSPTPKKQPPVRDSLDFAKSQMRAYSFDEAFRHPTLSDSELLSAALRTPGRPFGKADSRKYDVSRPLSSFTEQSIPAQNSFWLHTDSGINDGQDEDISSPQTLRDKSIQLRSSRSSADFVSLKENSLRLSDSSWISNDEENQLALPSPEVSWDQQMRRRSSKSSVDSISQGRNSRSISSIDQEIPTPVGTRKNSSLDMETASLLNRLEALHIREEESHSMFSKSFRTLVPEEAEEEREGIGHCIFRKMSHCTPVPEEDEDENEEQLDRPDGSQTGDGLNASLEEDIAEKAVEQLEADTFLSVFEVLVQECRQTEILTLGEALSGFCDLRQIKKLGEGTFGEAFKGGSSVFKIVPMDGKFQVNGEAQKTSAEMLSEVVLSNALNELRGGPMRNEPNICSTFVETKATRICQGCYDPELVRAWEEWDSLNTSENDHPSIFPNQQLYVVFFLTDGGRDLESFSLENFNEARSLLLQIVLALAVAEEACEFEHRDLHWGNIVLSRDQREHVVFRLLGQEKQVKTYGLSVSLIDFTLSRINTGNQVLFCNLAADPALFEGPKNDVQANTYRRMKKVTGGQWEQRFLQTNCLWIHYVADILLTKKTFSSSPAEKRSLRAFRKRVMLYESSGAAVLDEFFNGMWADV